MGRANGSRTRTCPICGKYYTHTNFMTRRGVRDKHGKLLDDTHRIACAKKRDKAEENPPSDLSETALPTVEA